jgi:hypothetical protein
MRIAKKRPHIEPEKQLTPVVVYLWAAGLAIIGYTLARILLGTYPHPYHWGALVVGGVVGYFWGWAWYRWRGDVF